MKKKCGRIRTSKKEETRKFFTIVRLFYGERLPNSVGKKCTNINCSPDHRPLPTIKNVHFFYL